MFFCKEFIVFYMPFAFREQRTEKRNLFAYSPFTSSQKHFNEA